MVNKNKNSHKAINAEMIILIIIIVWLKNNSSTDAVLKAVVEVTMWISILFLKS